MANCDERFEQGHVYHIARNMGPNEDRKGYPHAEYIECLHMEEDSTWHKAGDVLKFQVGDNDFVLANPQDVEIINVAE